jgi:hypothetical protein
MDVNFLEKDSVLGVIVRPGTMISLKSSAAAALAGLQLFP